MRHIGRGHAIALGDAGDSLIFASFDDVAPQCDFGRQCHLAVVCDLNGHIALDFVAARHQQRRAALDHHARRDVVGLPQFVLRHACLFGGIRGSHGRRRNPHCPAGQLRAIAFVQVALEYCRLIPRQQNLRISRREDHRAVDGWIERLEVVHRHLRQFGGHRHIDIAGNVDGLKERVVLDQRQS